MPKRADFYRLKAAECRAIAAGIKDQTSRAQLEKTAEHWLQLAEDAELIDRIKPDSRDKEPRVITGEQQSAKRYADNVTIIGSSPDTVQCEHLHRNVLDITERY